VWFADVALDVAWLLLACWLGWLLAPVLLRRWAPDPPAASRNRVVAAGVGIAATLNLAQAAVLDSVEDDSGLSRLDRPLLTWMVEHRSPDLTLVAKGVSYVGSPTTWTVLSVLVVLWLGWRRHWLDAALVAGAGAGAVLLVTVGKEVLGRPRPPVVDHLVVETNQSLPSGHALGSIVVLGVLVVLVLRRAASPVVRFAVPAAAAVAVCLIGLSRLYLGVHWSTDVLAGWLLGAAWLSACVTLLLARSGAPGTANGESNPKVVTGRPPADF
jgi:membrane-associated phospholipid phosphatase